MAQDAAAASYGALRLGPFWLAPGISRGNALTLLFGALTTLCLTAFVALSQPYLFALLGIPQAEQGSLSGLLQGLQEGTQILFAGLVGAFSDRSGRRLVYVSGLTVVALSFFAFPFAGSEGNLVAIRILYAIGYTAATVMLATCLAEYTENVTRGRWMGMVGVFNGLGIVLMATVLAKLPLWFANAGYDARESIRYSYWVLGTCLLLLALALRIGLRGRVGPPSRRGLGLVRQATLGLTAARENPRIGLAYLVAFASRGDLTIITTFISLWVIQAGLDAGMSLGAATARAGMIFGISQGVGLIWSVAMGLILDRLQRLTGVCVAFGIAGLGYSALGQVDDPFGSWMVPAALLAGLGEASVVVASGVLIGQEAPVANRGTVLGTFSLFGSLGILCLTWIGGQVFDDFGRSAPFAMMGLVNFLVLGAALWVRHRYSAIVALPGTLSGDAPPLK